MMISILFLMKKMPREHTVFLNFPVIIYMKNLKLPVILMKENWFLYSFLKKLYHGLQSVE